ncbi:hypothetical protein D9M72_624950 [compost metagenome]
MVLVAQQLDQVQRRGVVEALACLARQERVGIQARLRLGVELFQDGRLGGFQYAIQPAQHGEGQDDASVFGLLVVASKKVGDRPNEGREGLVVHQLDR